MAEYIVYPDGESYPVESETKKPDDLESVKAEIREFLPKIREVKKITEDDEFTYTMNDLIQLLTENEADLPEFAKLADWEGKPCHVLWRDGGYIVAFM